MRQALKVIASILFALSALVFVIGIIGTFASGGNGADFAQGITITAAAVTSLLLSGAVWLLADIAEAVQPKS